MIKKIAVVCNYQLLPDRVGGMDYFFWQFDAKCKENNIQVDWFFPNKSDHGSYSNLTIYASETKRVENNFLIFFKKSKSEYLHVITHFIELCTPFFYKIKKFSNAKVIVVDHNPRPLNGYSFKKKINKKIKGILFSRYIDLFVGVSNYTVKAMLADFGSHLKSKTQTIYNGVILDTILVRDYRNTVKPTFLVASHLRESKGIQDLIQAVFLLPQTIKNEIVIDVYGDGPYRKQLENQAANLALEICFNFKGSSAELKSIYCNYDYMLQPTHMECFSLSILESLAANVPVITTNVGGNEEAIVDGTNGYIFKAKDSNALASILEEVYLGTKMIHLDTRIAIENHFSLEQMVNQHFDLLLKN
jgi:glycosyltransferase involved in cell wall biosynthesis